MATSTEFCKVNTNPQIHNVELSTTAATYGYSISAYNVLTLHSNSPKWERLCADVQLLSVTSIELAEVVTELHIQEEMHFPALTEIVLEEGTIEHFSIDHSVSMPNLEMLNLSACPLKSFRVASNVWFPKLEDFDLSGTAISSLSIDLARQMPSIDLVDLSYTKIDTFSLAEGIQLLRLATIDLSGTEITSFKIPAGAKLPALQYLELGETPLHTIEIAKGVELKSLESLALTDTKLTHLPAEIITLPSQCTIGLEDTGISDHVQEQLREATRVPGYKGPSFRFSRIARSPSELTSLEQCLLTVNAHSNRPPLELEKVQKLNEEAGDNLRRWLGKTQDIFEASKAESQKMALYSSIADVVALSTLATKCGRAMCAELLVQLPSAIATCGDRMALSVIHLHLYRNSLVIDRKDLSSFAQFILLGQQRVDLLTAIARATINELTGFFDEIEVYLAFLVLLKEELNLPIPLNNMLFLSCAGIKDISGTMQKAKEQVLEMTEPIDAKINHLLKHGDFMPALREHSNAEVQAAIKIAEDAPIAECDAAYVEHVGPLLKRFYLAKGPTS